MDRSKPIRNYNGIIGLTSLNSNGDVDKKLNLYRMLKDKFVKVGADYYLVLLIFKLS